MEPMMLQLEFYDEKDECVVGCADTGVGQPIPHVGDLADVPNAGEEGKIAYVKVTGRHFYYGPEGDLSNVRLLCETL